MCRLCIFSTKILIGFCLVTPAYTDTLGDEDRKQRTSKELIMPEFGHIGIYNGALDYNSNYNDAKHYLKTYFGRSTDSRNDYLRKVYVMLNSEPIELFHRSIPIEYQKLANNIIYLKYQDGDKAFRGTAVVTGEYCDKVLTVAHNIINETNGNRYTNYQYRYHDTRFKSLSKYNVKTGRDKTNHNKLSKFGVRNDWSVFKSDTFRNNCINLEIKNGLCSGETFLLGYHKKYPNQLGITRNCNVSDVNSKYLYYLNKKFGESDSDTTVNKHTCTTYKYSSGGGVFCNENGKISIMGINTGGVKSKKTNDNKAYSERPPNPAYNYFNQLLRIDGEFLKAVGLP